MAKNKEKKREEKPEPPIKVGDKFLCPHCKIELPYNKDCPTCKLGIDWTKI